MTRVHNTTIRQADHHDWLEPGWMRRCLGPFLIAVAVVSAVAILIVLTSRPAWQLLGIGRGLVTPQYYPYTGLLIVLGTTLGQFMGWAAGSALLVYVWYRFTRTSVRFHVAQIAMTLVYAGLAVLPMWFYHLLFGRPLAGLPQPGLPAWLRQNAPDAYGLLIVGHPIVDWFTLPLAIAVLAMLWGYGQRLMRQKGLQTLWLFLILATSLVVTLSMAIHSTLVHVRIGA